MEPKKQAIVTALRAFINQRPGLEFGNYGSVASYRSECRSIARDKREALELLRAVEWRDSITADDIIEATRAFSGRLSIECRDDGSVRIDYCAGQYFPTEYRKAVCAVLASSLWDYTRDKAMPEPQQGTDGDGHEVNLYFAGNGRPRLRAGDWLREHFRREFGRSIASRWLR